MVARTISPGRWILALPVPSDRSGPGLGPDLARAALDNAHHRPARRTARSARTLQDHRSPQLCDRRLRNPGTAVGLRTAAHRYPLHHIEQRGSLGADPRREPGASRRTARIDADVVTCPEPRRRAAAYSVKNRSNSVPAPPKKVNRWRPGI